MATGFTYSGSIVTLTVVDSNPDATHILSGVYDITAYGGQGGSGGHGGGIGAKIKGEFNLTAGETLDIIVGGVGSDGTSPSGQPALAVAAEVALSYSSSPPTEPTPSSIHS